MKTARGSLHAIWLGLVLGLLAVSTAAPVRAAASTPYTARPQGPVLTCDGTWHVVATPDDHDSQEFAAVSALSDTDAWAAGAFVAGSPAPQPLFEHWNGRAWREVPGPYVADANMRGIAAMSSADVWAAGVRADVNPQALLLAQNRRIGAGARR